MIGGLCLGTALNLSAAVPYVPKRIDPLTEPWRWRALTELDDQGVNCLAEDADGSMWFGVSRGALRYDGLSWEAFGAENGFTSEAIAFICAASDGSIYASTGADVWHYSDGSWEKSALLVLVLSLDSAIGGGVWVGSNYGAIHLIENQPTLYTTKMNYAREMTPGFPKTTRMAWIPDELIAGSRCTVDSILEEPDGTVWLAVNSNELIRFNHRTPVGESTRFDAFAAGQKGLRLRGKIELNRDLQGVIWMGSPAGVYRYRAEFDDWTWVDLMGRDDFLGRYVALLSCQDGSRMVALIDTIYSLSNRQETACAFPSPEQSPPLLLESKNGSLWIGKRQGKLFRVDRTNRQWDSYADLNFQCSDGAGAQWFLTQAGQAVCRSDNDWVQYTEADGLMDTPVVLLADHAGHLWAAGSHRHAAATAWFDGQRWIRKLHPHLSESINGNTALALRDGSVLFGANNPRNRSASGGLIRAQKKADGTVEYEHVMHPAVPKVSTSLAEQADGRLWVSARSLYSISDDRLHPITQPQSLGKPVMTELGVDALDQVWAAKRDEGIYRLAGTNWTHYTAQDGLGGNRVADVLCTPQSVWVAMAGGISRFDGQTWIANVLGKDVPGFPLGGGSLRASDDGAVWINLAERNWFYREEFTDITVENYIYPFKTVRYRSGAHAPETDWEVTVDQVSPPGNVYFEWRGTSPWEATPRSQLQFSWRLNGGDWSPFSKESSRLFLALRPGTYQLDVRSRDMDFQVDPTPATWKFSVLAPVWQQSWFILLISLFSVGLAALAYFLLRANQRNQQHKLEIEQIKLRFFTNISHELRTPLTVMLGPLQSIYERIDQQEIKDRLRMVMRNGQKLRTLVDQILDFRKLEAGKMPIDWAHADFVQYTQSIFESMEAYGALEEVQCAFEVPRASCPVWFDPDKLQKILGNLLSNAIKFTPSGGRVKADLHIQYDAQGTPEQAVFCVEDSGVGIPLEAQSHVFEHYYRAESGARGTGLGLALVKDLLDLLEGSISLTSPLSDQGGTRFVVQLPLYAEAPEGVTDEQGVIPAGLFTMRLDDVPEYGQEGELSGTEGGPTLLVIDDHEDIRAFIRAELANSYSIVEAENGQIGLEKAAQIMPDLVISDVMMPVMDGIEFCRLLKTTEVTSHIPVILLTARASEQHELEGLETGADDYVTKPFSMPLLKARIHSLLESRRIMRERFSRQIQFGTEEIPTSSVDQLFLERVMQLIHERMGDYEFTVEVFANAMNMSLRSLQIKIKAVTDQTPNQLIRTLRLKQAKQWLEQPDQDRSISEIAAAVGFLDMSYFSRAFKKQFGLPPSEVMNQAKNSDR